MNNTKMEILYEDNHLIAVNKRAGELSQGDKTGDDSLLEQIKSFIKHRDQKPGKVFLGLIHRLDRPTSGVMVFAKTSKALERMNKLFKTREVEKKYWALTEKSPEIPKQDLTHYLRKNPKNNKVSVFTKPTEGAKEARSSYEILTELDNYTLVEVEIYTGRSHQVRSQLAFIGCTIRGDLKYGAKRSNKDKSISLHSRTLAFEHPIKKTPISIKAPVPNDPIWLAAERNSGT